MSLEDDVREAVRDSMPDVVPIYKSEIDNLVSAVMKAVNKSCPEIDNLACSLAALERIVESDPGPAYHIAKSALDQIRKQS